MRIINFETAKAINNLSKRLFEIENKLEQFLLNKYEENKEAILCNDGGIIDIANIVSNHDEAIKNLETSINNVLKNMNIISED